MGFIVYTDASGQSRSIEIDFQRALRSSSVQKVVKRSLGGRMEVIKHYTDRQWQITFEPVNGPKLERVRDFLDSTDGGQSFLIDPYGTSSSLKSMKRTDDGHSEDEFMRGGSPAADYIQISITAIEL